VTPLARRLLAVLALVLALAGAFVAGRFSAPLKVDVQEIDRIVYRDRIVTVKGKTETKIVYRDRVVTPDGTVKERSVEKTASREDLERTSNRNGETERRVETATTSRPEWRVGVLAGASLQPPAVPLAGPLVIGVQVERRITGGLSAGAWANTSGAAGALVSLEF
jgi:hypothetical protein